MPPLGCLSDAIRDPENVNEILRLFLDLHKTTKRGPCNANLRGVCLLFYGSGSAECAENSVFWKMACDSALPEDYRVELGLSWFTPGQARPLDYEGAPRTWRALFDELCEGGRSRLSSYLLRMLLPNSGFTTLNPVDTLYTVGAWRFHLKRNPPPPKEVQSTPLHNILGQRDAFTDHGDTISKLLAVGADPNSRMKALPAYQAWKAFLSPLALSISMLHPVSGVRLLLEHGADVDRMGDYNSIDGMTCLMMAAAMDLPSTVKLLLEHGAEVDRRDRYGRSALMYCLLHPKSWTSHWSNRIPQRGGGYGGGAENAFEMLLQHRADVNATDAKGASVLDYALRPHEPGAKSFPNLQVDAIYMVARAPRVRIDEIDEEKVWRALERIVGEMETKRLIIELILRHQSQHFDGARRGEAFDRLERMDDGEPTLFRNARGSAEYQWWG